MNCIGFALGLVMLNCTPSAPLITEQPRLCAVMTAPIPYQRSIDDRTRRRLRSINAIWRATCQKG